MRVGTRSVLFGAHAFWLHPFVIAAAWWRLYGFPHDPRLWVAFFIHDLGYWGKPNMDGVEGETHPEWGARVMARLFGPAWGVFTLTHSRYYAARMGLPPSRLCIADKLAIVIEPVWLYLPRVWLTGEYREYMTKAERMSRMEPATEEERRTMGAMSILPWCRGMRAYTRRWVETHRAGGSDEWTSLMVADGHAAATGGSRSGSQETA
jgi:hypothetical protein